MSQMNPKEAFHNTVYSVQLPYIAGHSLLRVDISIYLGVKQLYFLNPIQGIILSKPCLYKRENVSQGMEIATKIRIVKRLLFVDPTTAGLSLKKVNLLIKGVYSDFNSINLCNPPSTKLSVCSAVIYSILTKEIVGFSGEC